MRNFGNTLFILLLNLAVFTPSAACADEMPLPSYEQQKQQFMEERKNYAEAPKFSDEDRRVMNQAAEELAARLPEPAAILDILKQL